MYYHGRQHHTGMTSTAFMGDMPAGVQGRDPVFTEAINQKMRVPDRLRVGPEQRGGAEEDRGRQRTEEPPPAYSMHIPDRLALTDAPDMSPRPLFTSSKPGSSAQAGPAWESQYLAWESESFHRDPGQSPLRRSYSDTAFGRTPPGTPTHTKQALHTPSSRSTGHLPQQAPPAAPPPLGLLSPQTMLQAARQLGQQASQRLLQTVTQKYRSRFGGGADPAPPPVVAEPPPHGAELGRKSAMQESWLGQEDESGAVVEFIVLRRQVVKMSRRLAGLERQNAERRQTELVLFSLLLSACLLNGWLWIRR
ncbi:mitochondrial fission factor-like isoform X1 [Osmerus mordax]|uniref:mitochondrial fission factor-like isoform X1 n=2 Tax=Osmerus mordax TaxID=8014 RepID=UPI00350F9ACA